ncbi:MAG: tryptophan 7-halogenase, partial [Acidobacteriota bacterium]|nr:tryptophan 7-halogenase [Acidobacteriota bacterium]
MRPNHVDVVIIGAGLAGLTLARQLMMQKPLTVLHLEKREHVPVTRQKVGESNVQVQGWYLGKVLDLEEYLFHEHLMKYNLRFLWPTGAGDDFTDYGQSYIRNFSNIPCYQLDRNKFEGKLIELNRENEGYNLVTGVRKLQVDLKEDAAPHELTWKVGDAAQSVTADWVIDSTGRSRVLARDMDMRVNAPFRHSAAYFWVDGTVNIEKLTRAGRAELLRHPSRRELGHLPFWLATNHFMGEGYWFWVIPLQGRTSFGLVFDNHLIDPASVNRPEKLLSWLKEHIPLFQFDRQDLIDFSFLANFAHGCDRTIHRNRWAMTGESGRFTDPLYSPGGDLIAIHNTLITDAVLTDDPAQLMGKIGRYETMFKVFYHSFIPSYDPGYLSLGDQEIFAMKYSWELAIYFGYFV